MSRAGGYFVWATQPVYKHEDKLQEQWKEMEDLTGRICWELIAKGYITTWHKPLNNTCYFTHNQNTQPPICEEKDEHDNVWYVPLKACITKLPENGCGGNVTEWPARLHHPLEGSLKV